MAAIPRSQRIFFGVISAAALLVAALGIFAPERLAAILSWLALPPLHARFVGVLYLYGAVFTFGCMIARHPSQARYGLAVIAVWTGLLLLVSVLSLQAFDFNLLPPWLWFASYIVYPLLAIALLVKSRGRPAGETPGTPLPGWARLFMQADGAIVTVLALALIAAPGLIGRLWPWPITPLTAQTYGGPLLAYGLGSWWYARGTWSSVRAVVTAAFVFNLGVVLVSIVYLPLFSLSEIPDLLWFLGFGASAAFLTLMLGGLRRGGEPAAEIAG